MRKDNWNDKDVNINKCWNYVTKSLTMRLMRQVILNFLMKVKIKTEDFSKESGGF